jgi:hypothetical protein
MRSLSQIIILLTMSVSLCAQSPHGKNLTLQCSDCHNPKGWRLEAGTYSFSHESTRFPLTGLHKDVECKQCHPSLVFSEAEMNCVSCHTDMHEQTVGMDCERCHTTQSWLVNDINEIHRHSRFPLTGAHLMADCYSCHPSASLLKFEPLGIECYDCHSGDYTSAVNPNHVLGNFSIECTDCHLLNAVSWGRFDHFFFPLTNGHALNDCSQCHKGSGSFEDLSPECYSCHQADYASTTSPNHSANGYSTECTICHTTSPGWKPAEVDHSFFQLTYGHDNLSCADCHQDQNYSNISNVCYDCHQSDFNAATNPNHVSANFSTTCTECHTTLPDWKPANFQQHDGLYFPVYSGKHKFQDVWDNCSECHFNTNDYGSFNCTANCHPQGQMDNEHNEVGGYIYSDVACYECHPTGNAEGGFNHNLSNFPLTGAHVTTECLQCHANGYAGTTTVCGDCHATAYNQSLNPNHLQLGISNDCASCHTTDPGWTPATFAIHNDYYALTGGHAVIAQDCNACHAGDYVNTPVICFACHEQVYNQTTNPNHVAINIPNDCAACHTTNPDWTPATFAIHNEYYILEGAHAAIANNCAICHNGNYNYTPNTCYGCHSTDYNQTTNPPHQTAQFPTDCETCHTQTAWVPSTFEHDAQYFPIYSGAHNGEWDLCSDCHTNPTNYSEFTCLPCHPQPETDNEHEGITGYTYNSEACYACHPDGSGAGGFNHDNTNFPLTGAHTTVNCIECHQNGYQGTSTVCFDCHEDSYNQSTNPNHTAIGIPNECETCHTTNPNWQPATFPIHNNYYVLAGAHIAIANDCAVCHNGNYNNTPNTCYGCHATDYNQTNDPPHQSAQFPTDCEMCHTQNAWLPSTFDHDSQYFPIYSGSHNNEWNQCSDCHTNPTNYQVFTCLPCHPQGEMDDEHSDVTGYQYNSDACYACHPTGNGGQKQLRIFKD